MIRVRVPQNHMQSLTLRRYSDGGYVDGLWVENVPAETIIRASVQPLTAAQNRLLPEGESPLKYRTVFTNYILQMPSNNIKPDEIIHKGLIYRMADFIDWEDNGYTMAFFKQMDQVA